jgi:ubiquinol-cytochrome c reductase cytochrome c1 subunit
MFTTDKAFDTASIRPCRRMPRLVRQAAAGPVADGPRARRRLYLLVLKGFYVDKTRPWGVNNLYLPGAAMPHVLAQLQGLQKPVFKNEPDDQRRRQNGAGGVEPMTPGAMKPEEYDQFVGTSPTFWTMPASPSRPSANPWAFL